jgi:hypothetical protein
MPLTTNPSTRTALTFITVGALIDIWAAVWWWYLWTQPTGDVDRSWWFVCAGLLLTGAILIVIGLAVGRIGRAAVQADTPPVVVVPQPQPATAQAPAAATAPNGAQVATTTGPITPAPGT